MRAPVASLHERDFALTKLSAARKSRTKLRPESVPTVVNHESPTGDGHLYESCWHYGMQTVLYCIIYTVSICASLEDTVVRDSVSVHLLCASHHGHCKQHQPVQERAANIGRFAPSPIKSAPLESCAQRSQVGHPLQHTKCHKASSC